MKFTAALLAATATASKKTWLDRCDYAAVPACEDPTSSLRTYSTYSLCMSTIGCYQQIDYMHKDLVNLGETITGVNGGNPFANLIDSSYDPRLISWKVDGGSKD